MVAVTVPSSRGPVIGRESESALLADLVQELAGGRGSVVEIAGDPGSGKTRLATGLVELAAQQGLLTVRARASRGNARPCQVFRDAWSVRPGVGSFTNRAAEALPEALEGFGEWARGSVVVLDDVHWCDPASVELLVGLIRSTAPRAFLLVLVHRSRQTPPALLAALQDGVHTGGVTRLELGPLDNDATAALLAGPWADDISGVERGAPSAEFVDRLCTAAQGNPRYLRLLVAAGWHPDDWPHRPGNDVDGLLREAAPLVAELGSLSSDAADTAVAAAVLGSPIRLRDVAQVSGLGLERTLDALGDLVRADLVRSAGWGGRLDFRHPLVGHVAHETAELSLRIRAHRRALHLVTARGDRACERARHAEHLLGTDAAASGILLAGAAEIVVRAPRTAARWLRLAIEAYPDGAEASGPRGAVRLALCRALIAAGLSEEARALAHELLGNGLDSLTDEQRWQAHAICAGAERLLGRYEEAEALASAGLGLLPRPLADPLPAAALELITEYGLVHALRGTHDRASPLLHEASGVRSAADAGARIELRVLTALSDTCRGLVKETGPEVSRCARLVDALPDEAAHTSETFALLGTAELYLERYADAYRHLGRGLGPARVAPQRHVFMRQLLGLSMVDQWTGRLDASRNRALEAEHLARSVGAPDAVGLATAIRVLSGIWHRGSRYAAETVVRAEEVLSNSSLNRSWWTSSATGLLAQARLLAGDAAGCVRTLMDGQGGQGGEGGHGGHGGWGGEMLSLSLPTCRPSLLSLLSMAALRCGDRDLAHRTIRIADREADRLGLRGQEAWVFRARAELHRADGEQDAAAKLFALSADGFRTAGMPVHHAWTLAIGARSTHAVRGPEAAAGQLETAEAIARTFGARLVHEQVAQVRAELVQPTGQYAFLGHLTDREREIAGLAATGLRNRQIAERLFLSPRTVDAHLASVYRKLGVTSRLALTHLLLRRGA
ncbi:helix-turn-helix transcriptional regulator [Streptomyces sp. AK08-02]|uniref:helix-turn-helix transcriptional regulator n=1 Tax=Streptomyces sp. AK08-02 TaxID=3028654 RepID=UPI0029A3E2B6|nr:LuxR C-terminal-related transcriptional regulator [Streptomyces sp. AK08-02]MDX3749124.1 LuxR C-terminal-related transcriptional regulator [Streptomyces sp. AK08-02]